MELELPGIDESEITNSIVTISLLQVALRAEARRLQTVLTDLGANADTSTSEGLFALLQQTASALLDYSRYWTHVLANSQTVNTIEEAEQLYNQYSLAERSKFSVESFSNVNGVIKRQVMQPSPETPAYIVVTLLLGTADDNPLFEEIYSASVLRDVLNDIRTMQPRYLMVFEVLWSPQDSSDSMTAEELTTEYSDLVEIF